LLIYLNAQKHQPSATDLLQQARPSATARIPVCRALSRWGTHGVHRRAGDVIARGVFTSVSDLKRKLMRYIRKYNE